MNSKELKEYILKNNKVEEILEDLGCSKIKFHEPRGKDTCGYWSAARNGGDNPMGVVIKNCEYLNYYSYSQGIDIDEGKDIFAFIQDTKHITFTDTMKYVHKLLGLKYEFKLPKVDDKPKFDPLAIFKKAATKKRYVDVRDVMYLDENILDDFVPMLHIDMLRDGVMPKSAKKFGWMYSYKHHRQIIPFRDFETGALVGYTGRSTIESCEELGISKYFISPGYNKQANLYGLWENKESICKAGYITIFESEKSVLKRDSRNDSTGVAISGHSLSNLQVEIILGLQGVTEVVIAMDKDVPIEEVWAMCEKFYHLRKVSYIEDQWDLMGAKDSPADSHDKIYKFLFKHRIEYDESKHKQYLDSLKKNYRDKKSGK